jgi:hypothetical protein
MACYGDDSYVVTISQSKKNINNDGLLVLRMLSNDVSKKKKYCFTVACYRACVKETGM